MPRSFGLPGGTSGSLRGRGGFAQSLRAQQGAAPLVSGPQKLNGAAPPVGMPQMGLSQAMQQAAPQPQQTPGFDQMIQKGGIAGMIGAMGKHGSPFGGSTNFASLNKANGRSFADLLGKKW